ncbi:MAG: asparagine synthetase B family protein [Allosphingosinicella sp.]
MSAIAGFWSLADRPDAEARCREMLAALSLYGPDETAAARFGPAALGRALYRLLPEDQHDRQPLRLAGGAIALVADLRLDNRPEIASALGLSPGEAARLADAALLAAAVERWGVEGATARLLGDFAFALFEPEAHRLTLVRDPLGQRPLFWARAPGFAAFASMPQGLHALPGLERRPDGEEVARFLALLPRRGPGSYFEGVRRVEPGHLLVVEPDRETARRYWRPRREPLRLPRFADYVDAYRDELDRAVRVRMRRAEGPLAAHLSGGWDSGAVAATAARLDPGSEVLAYTSVPRTHAADSGRRFADEGPLAAATASFHPNLRHVLIPQTGASPLAGLDRNVALFERPLFNLCNHVWLVDIRAAAREAGARVLLGGEIGNWTISAGRVELLADFLREGRPLDWWRSARGLLRAGRARRRGVLAASFGAFLSEPLWRLARFFASDGAAGLSPALRGDALARMDAERSAFLPERRLDRVDLALAAFGSMDWGEHRKGILGGWGIDKRDPTADVRLIEFCLSLPLDLLMKDGERRPLARAALADRLPAAVLDHPGKGYQNAGWHEGLTADRARLEALVAAIGADPLAGSIVDANRLARLIAAWPEGGWERPEIVARYRNLLLQAVSAGHFLLAAQRPLPAGGAMPLQPGA